MLPITRILFVIVFSAAAYGCVSPQSVGPEQGETFTIEDRSYTEVVECGRAGGCVRGGHQEHG
jgi:hypothetical protein